MNKTITYFEVIHLTADGERGGGFAAKRAESLEEAREIIKNAREHTPRSDTSDREAAENIAYWAAQNYAIHKVTRTEELIEKCLTQDTIARLTLKAYKG